MSHPFLYDGYSLRLYYLLVLYYTRLQKPRNHHKLETVGGLQRALSEPLPDASVKLDQYARRETQSEHEQCLTSCPGEQNRF